ncbi:unnamed protein product, partial [Symbiodinium microadriaticum]
MMAVPGMVVGVKARREGAAEDLDLQGAGVLCLARRAQMLKEKEAKDEKTGKGKKGVWE